MNLSRLARFVLVLGLLFCRSFGAEIPLGSQNTADIGKAGKMLVPFVGCKAVGQAGPVDAPQIPKHRVELEMKVAQRLGIYETAAGPWVVGPSGWSCLAVYGSGGATLYVTPEQLSGVFPLKWEIVGPGIAASSFEGET